MEHKKSTKKKEFEKKVIFETREQAAEANFAARHTCKQGAWGKLIVIWHRVHKASANTHPIAQGAKTTP